MFLNILTGVISDITFSLFVFCSVYSQISLWLKWKTLHRSVWYTINSKCKCCEWIPALNNGPSVTRSISVSPPVCLLIFWMGVSVASAPPQIRPRRWKECRPPPVTLPAHPFRTFPPSDPPSVTDVRE